MNYRHCKGVDQIDQDWKTRSWLRAIRPLSISGIDTVAEAVRRGEAASSLGPKSGTGEEVFGPSKVELNPVATPNMNQRIANTSIGLYNRTLAGATDRWPKPSSTNLGR